MLPDTSDAGRVPAPMIVGCPRSGTTLVRSFLDSHPDLAIPGESDVTVRLLDAVPRDAAASGRLSVARARDILSTAPKVAAWGIDPLAALDDVEVDASGEVVAAAVVRALHQRYAALRGRPRWGDKTPYHGARLPLLAAALPEVVVVHVLRDPRSVVAALRAVSWAPDDVGACARIWWRSVAAARGEGLRLGPDRYLEVRYEDLLADPEPHLRRACHRAGLAWDPAVLDRRDASERARAASEFPDDHANLDRDLVETRDWQRELSRTEVRRVEAITGDLMAACGYEPRTPPLSVAATTVRALDSAAWAVRTRGRAAIGRLPSR